MRVNLKVKGKLEDWYERTVVAMMQLSGQPVEESVETNSIHADAIGVKAKLSSEGEKIVLALNAKDKQQVQDIKKALTDLTKSPQTREAVAAQWTDAATTEAQVEAPTEPQMEEPTEPQVEEPTEPQVEEPTEPQVEAPQKDMESSSMFTDEDPFDDDEFAPPTHILSKKMTALIIGGAAVLLILLAVVIAFMLFGRDNQSSENVPSTSAENEATVSVAPTPTAPAVIPAALEFKAGHYVSGKDFPAGTYKFTATSGNGTIKTLNKPDGDIRQVMALTPTAPAVTELADVALPAGTDLFISNVVTIHMDCPDADVAGQVPRQTVAGTPVDLNAGNYTAGKDFPAGTYNVVATGSGATGAVISSNGNVDGIDEVMGTTGTEYVLPQYLNLTLAQDVTLMVKDTTVQLVPVGN